MTIDFEAWKRKERAASQVRGRHYQEWRQEIARLKKARQFADALRLLHECIDATERENKITGSGCPHAWFYEQAAMINQRQRDFAAETEVLERYLRAASDRPARAAVVARYEKAWRRRGGDEIAPVVPPAVPAGGLAQLLESERREEAARAEAVARRFLAEPVLPDDEEESYRRMKFGLPSHLLDKQRWRREAITSTAHIQGAESVVDALVERSDRWGVLEPDHTLVAQTFVTGHSYTVIDLRTGEEVRTSFGTTVVELWLSAETDCDLRTVDAITTCLSRMRSEMIMYWAIPGDIMNGKAELRTLRD